MHSRPVAIDDEIRSGIQSGVYTDNCRKYNCNPFQSSTLAEGPKEQLLTLLGQQGTEKLAALLQAAEQIRQPSHPKNGANSRSRCCFVD